MPFPGRHFIVVNEERVEEFCLMQKPCPSHRFALPQPLDPVNRASVFVVLLFLRFPQNRVHPPREGPRPNRSSFPVVPKRSIRFDPLSQRKTSNSNLQRAPLKFVTSKLSQFPFVRSLDNFLRRGRSIYNGPSELAVLSFA